MSRAMCWGRLVHRISFGTTGVLHRPSRRTRIVSNGSAGAATATLQHDVEWRLRLAYTDEEGAGTMVIDDGGKPFQTTAHGRSDPLPGQRHYDWADGVWVGS